MKPLVIIALILFVLLFPSCKQHRIGISSPGQERASSVVADSIPDSALLVSPVYATGFRVEYRSGGVRLVDIQDPQAPHAATYHFALLPQGVPLSCAPEGYTPVHIPVESVVCMTSLQLSNFIALGACDFVRGITSTRHLFNKEMNERLASGRTSRIGIEGNFDNELVMALAPDVIFISPFKRGGYEALHETNVPLVPHLGYKETTPLGQAEWVKFIGLFIGKEREANRLFAAIEQRYSRLKTLTAGVAERPTVFSGELRGENWYAVGGQSFLAQLFCDAGADYFLKDDMHSGGVTLDFETVYSRAESTGYWRIVNSYDGQFSYDALRASDARYADFRAFRERKVIYCNIRQTPFYERMPMQPDVILADLIHIFHPSLLPAHTPVYYSLLQ